MWIRNGEPRRLSISGLSCTRGSRRVRARCDQEYARQTQPCVRFFSSSASLCSGNASGTRGSGSCAGHGCCPCCWLSVEDESPLLFSLTVPLRSSHAEKSVFLQPHEETLRCRHRRCLLFFAFRVWNIMTGGFRPECVLSEDISHQERQEKYGT